MQNNQTESDKLKLEYCKEIGSDSIIGLDVCDDYKDWLISKEQDAKSSIMELPNENPVLAKVQGQTDLGLTSWLEVVWHNEIKWCSFCGSDTFDNGEQVVAWTYLDGIEFTNTI